MYCQYCEKERPRDWQVCRSCGSKLIARSEKERAWDRGRVRYLLEQLACWESEGALTSGLVMRLSAPYREQLALMEGEVAPATSTASSRSEAARPQPEACAPAVVVAEAVSPETPKPPIRVSIPSLEATPRAPAASTATPSPLPRNEAPVRSVPAKSWWKEHIRPNLSVETIVWFVGAFLLIAGSIYFVHESQGLFRALLVSGMLAAYAWGFGEAGRRLALQRKLPGAGRVLAAIACALGPIAAAATDPLRGSQRVVWMVASGVVAVAMGVLVSRCARLFWTDDRSRFAQASTALIVLTVAAPFATEAWALAPAALAAVGLAVLFLCVPLLAAQTDRAARIFLGATLAYDFVALVVRSHFHAAELGYEPTLAAYGVLLALALAVYQRSLRAISERAEERPVALVIAGHAGLVPALLMTLSSGKAAAIASVIATVILAEAARHYRRAACVYAAAATTFVAYQTAPLLIPGPVLALLRVVKEKLGYPPAPMLPWNYGAVSNLVFLTMVAITAVLLHQRKAAFAARPMANVTFGTAAVLMIFSHCGFDVRPGLWVSAAIFAGGLALAHALSSRRFSYLAAAGAIEIAVDLAIRTGHGWTPVVLALGVVSLALGAFARIETRHSPAFGAGSLAALALGVSAAPGVEIATMGCAALCALAAASLVSAHAFRSRVTALIGWVLASSALLVGMHRLGLPGDLVPWAAFALGLAGLVAAGRDRLGAVRPSTPPLVADLFPLPLLDAGNGLWREPLAACSGGLVILAAVIAVPLQLTRGSAFGLAEGIFWILVARRQKWVGPTFLAAATLSIGVWRLGIELGAAPGPFLASASVGLALLAAGLRNSVPLSKALLRLEPREASLSFGMTAVMTASLSPLAVFIAEAGSSSAGFPATCAISAVAFLVLCRWWRTPAWLYPAALLGAVGTAGAVGLEREQSILALAGLLLLAVAESTQHRSLVRRVFSLEALPLMRHLGVIAHLAAVGSIVAMVISLSQGAPTVSWIPVALLSSFYLVAPRNDGRAIWVLGFGAFAGAAAAIALPAFAELALAATGVGLGVAACLARASPRAVWRVTGVSDVDRWASGAAAVGALAGLASVVLSLMRTPFGPDSAWPLGLGAVIALLVARAVREPRFLMASAGLFSFAAYAYWVTDPAMHILVPAVGALALLGCAMAIRRFSAVVSRLLDTDAAGATRALWSTLAVGVVSALAVPFIVVLGSAEEPWIPLLLSATFFLLAPVVTRQRRWLPVGSVLLLLALGRVGDFEAWQVVGCGMVNGLLLIGAILARNAGTTLWLRFIDFARSPIEEDHPVKSPVPVILWTSWGISLALLVVPLGLGILGYFGFEKAHTATEWAVFAAQALTALHLLYRMKNRASMHTALVLPPLVAAWWPGAEWWCVTAAAVAAVYAGLALVAQTARPWGALERRGILFATAVREHGQRWAGRWAAVLAILALVSSGADYRVGLTAIAVALATVTFGLRALRRAGLSVDIAVALTLAPASLHFALFFLGYTYSAGRPQEVILPFVALTTGVICLLAEKFGHRPPTWLGVERGKVIEVAAHVYFALSAAELGAGIALIEGMRTSEFLVSLAAIVPLAWFAIARARSTARQVYAYLAEAAIVAVYLLVRAQVIRVPVGDFDAIALLALGFAFLGLHWIVKRFGGQVFERPTLVAAHIAPLLAVCLVHPHASQFNALITLGAAVHFTALRAWTKQGTMATLLAGAFYNIAIGIMWISLDQRDPQLYAIPFGLTLIVLGRLFRDDLDAEWQARLRIAGIVIIYSASAWQALLFENPIYPLVAACLCVLGIAAGILWKVRAYLYLGTAFLVTVVLGNMARYGLRDHRLGATFLTLLGLGIVGGMVYFTAKRTEVERRFRELQLYIGTFE
jgi:hypothetical protein